MFSRKSFGLLSSLYLAGATSPDACVSSCGSAASSSNPYGDMNNLLKSGTNCPSPYAPLSPQGTQYGGYGGDSCMIPGYYPSQQNSTGYPQPGYPGMNGAGTTPISGMTNNDECEVTTSIECKPRRGGSQNFIPSAMYSSYGSLSSAIPMSNIIGGGASTKPYTVPGSSPICDCSQFINGMTNGNYPSGPQPFQNGSDMCNCIQQQQPYSQNGIINGQTMPGSNGGGIMPSNGLLPGQKSMYCGGNGWKNPYDNSNLIGGRTPGSILNTFDCCKSQTYQSSPVKTAIIGTSELPISDNFRATPSSCGPAPCF